MSDNASNSKDITPNNSLEDKKSTIILIDAYINHGFLAKLLLKAISKETKKDTLLIRPKVFEKKVEELQLLINQDNINYCYNTKRLDTSSYSSELLIKSLQLYLNLENSKRLICRSAFEVKSEHEEDYKTFQYIDRWFFPNDTKYKIIRGYNIMQDAFVNTCHQIINGEKVINTTENYKELISRKANEYFKLIENKVQNSTFQIEKKETLLRIKQIAGQLFREVATDWNLIIGSDKGLNDTNSYIDPQQPNPYYIIDTLNNHPVLDSIFNKLSFLVEAEFLKILAELIKDKLRASEDELNKEKPKEQASIIEPVVKAAAAKLIYDQLASDLNTDIDKNNEPTDRKVGPNNNKNIEPEKTNSDPINNQEQQNNSENGPDEPENPVNLNGNPLPKPINPSGLSSSIRISNNTAPTPTSEVSNLQTGRVESNVSIPNTGNLNIARETSTKSDTSSTLNIGVASEDSINPQSKITSGIVSSTLNIGVAVENSNNPQQTKTNTNNEIDSKQNNLQSPAQIAVNNQINTPQIKQTVSLNDPTKSSTTYNSSIVRITPPESINGAEVEKENIVNPGVENNESTYAQFSDSNKKSEYEGIEQNIKNTIYNLAQTSSTKGQIIRGLRNKFGLLDISEHNPNWQNILFYVDSALANSKKITPSIPTSDEVSKSNIKTLTSSNLDQSTQNTLNSPRKLNDPINQLQPTSNIRSKQPISTSNNKPALINPGIGEKISEIYNDLFSKNPKEKLELSRDEQVEFDELSKYDQFEESQREIELNKLNKYDQFEEFQKDEEYKRILSRLSFDDKTDKELDYEGKVSYTRLPDGKRIQVEERNDLEKRYQEGEITEDRLNNFKPGYTKLEDIPSETLEELKDKYDDQITNSNFDKNLYDSQLSDGSNENTLQKPIADALGDVDNLDTKKSLNNEINRRKIADTFKGAKNALNIIKNLGSLLTSGTSIGLILSILLGIVFSIIVYTAAYCVPIEIVRQFTETATLLAEGKPAEAAKAAIDKGYVDSSIGKWLSEVCDVNPCSTNGNVTATTSTNDSPINTECIEKQIQGKGDDDTIKLWRAQGGVQLIDIKVGNIRKIQNAAKEANVPQYALDLALGACATESNCNFDKYDPSNPNDCYGIIQFCRAPNAFCTYQIVDNWLKNGRKPNTPNKAAACSLDSPTNPQTLLKDPVLQMKFVAIGYQLKLSENKSVSKLAGRSELYKVAASWLGLGESGDAYGTKYTHYGEAAEKNKALFSCTNQPTTTSANTTSSTTKTSFNLPNIFAGLEVEAASTTLETLKQIAVDPINNPDLNNKEKALLDTIAVKEGIKYNTPPKSGNQNQGKYQILESDKKDAQTALNAAGYSYKIIDGDWSANNQDYLAIGRILRNAQMSPYNDKRKLSEILDGENGFLKAITYAHNEFQALPPIPGVNRRISGVDNGLTVEIIDQYFKDRYSFYNNGGSVSTNVNTAGSTGNSNCNCPPGYIVVVDPNSQAKYCCPPCDPKKSTVDTSDSGDELLPLFDFIYGDKPIGETIDPSLFGLNPFSGVNANAQASDSKPGVTAEMKTKIAEMIKNGELVLQDPSDKSDFENARFHPNIYKMLIYLNDNGLKLEGGTSNLRPPNTLTASGNISDHSSNVGRGYDITSIGLKAKNDLLRVNVTNTNPTSAPNSEAIKLFSKLVQESNLISGNQLLGPTAWLNAGFVRTTNSSHQDHIHIGVIGEDASLPTSSLSNISCVDVASTQSDSQDLQAIVDKYKEGSPLQSIVVRELETDKIYQVNGNQRPGNIASTIKSVIVYIVIEEELVEKNIDPKSTTITAHDFLINSSDGYTPGNSYSVERLINDMIKESNNSATNLLIHYFGNRAKGTSNPNIPDKTNAPKAGFTSLIQKHKFNNTIVNRYLGLNNGYGFEEEYKSLPKCVESDYTSNKDNFFDRCKRNTGTALDTSDALDRMFSNPSKYKLATDALNVAIDQYGLKAVAAEQQATILGQKYGGVTGGLQTNKPAFADKEIFIPPGISTVLVYQAKDGRKFAVSIYIDGSFSDPKNQEKIRNAFEDIIKLYSPKVETTKTEPAKTSLLELLNPVEVEAQGTITSYNQLTKGHLDFLAEVAKERGYEALKDAGSVNPQMKTAFAAMQTAARNAGFSLGIVSGQANTFGYRSYNYQTQLYFGQTIQKVWREGLSKEELAEVKRQYLKRGEVSAPPGYSEHSTGLSIDVISGGNDSLTTSFGRTGLYKWLKNEGNAAKFGFTESYPEGYTKGANWEPWHWRFDGNDKFPLSNKLDSFRVNPGETATASTSNTTGCILLGAANTNENRDNGTVTTQDGGFVANPGGFAWPVDINKYPFTSPFGPRWGTFHSGVDIGTPVGVQVRASADGVVVQAGFSSGGGGNQVTIKHKDDTLTLYMHNSQISTTVGKEVKQGDIIAISGNTGNSTGPHVHFQIEKGSTRYNPCTILDCGGKLSKTPATYGR
jgi:murein DD-endopeptidase MepM/ murein hydrolase activator NlpD